MASPLVETLSDLLSASGGALAGAIVTGLFNRGRNKQLSDQVMAGQVELEKREAENQRLLSLIRDKEDTIMRLEMAAMTRKRPATTRKTTRRK